ncbi:MAG: glycosyltransferase family 2 protein [Treponema sp.]|nr:glycosyltransferase family 2 protein [Treponema sp.]
MLSVSIVTPVFNSMRTLDVFMEAILMQDFPHDKMEIVFADGGSTDGSREKIQVYADSNDIAIRLLENPLKTAEAGKAVAVRQVQGDVICLLDSDNILPDSHWLSQMMQPFEKHDIVASEPISYTWRKEDCPITRYCAMLGMSDPLCLYAGNYDRMCAVSGTWTKVPHKEEDCGSYLSIEFDHGMMPTIGANGFCMKRKELVESFEGNYLFDIDVLWELIQKKSETRIAKVKNGIVHLVYPDLKTFARKQDRRIRDFLFFSGNKGRKYPWSSVGMGKVVLFCLCTVTLLPVLVQMLIGFFRKGDIVAWLLHPLCCWITLFIYARGVVSGLFVRKQADRTGWKQ